MTSSSANNTSEKLFLKALQKKPVPRIPVWFMRQAGRYLPEYRALRATKKGFLDMAYDPAAACEITLQPIRRFHMDAAILFSDILVIPHALGQNLDFVAGEGPKLDALSSAADLARLSLKNIHTVLDPVYEAVSRIAKNLDIEGYSDVALIGFAGSPWTVATYMIEGGSSKDFMDTKVFAYADPQGFSALIDLLVEATSAYLIRQIDAGAQAVQLFDSWASALDAAQFRRWVIEPTTRIVNTIRAVHPDIPVIGFPKGAGTHYPAYARETGVTALGLDSALDPAWAAQELQSLLPVQGNLDPACLKAGGPALEGAIDSILRSLGHAPFVFNLGHGINKDTPIAHVEAALKKIRSYTP